MIAGGTYFDPRTKNLYQRDPEKNTTHSVVKQIIGLFDNRPADSDEVIYQGVSVALRPLLLSSVSKELLVSDDVKFLEENEEYQGIIVAVSDIDGNILNYCLVLSLTWLCFGK